MRICVVNTQLPFDIGGAESHSASLVKALNDYGHEATEVTLPFKWVPIEALADHILAAKLSDLSDYCDLMIGLRFPAYLVKHPNPVFWIIHQYRQVYDLWGSGESYLLDQPNGEAARQMVEIEDHEAFERSSRPIFANSKNVANRLRDYLAIKSEVLYHPPPLANRIYGDHYNGSIFSPGRITSSKRIDLMIRALATTPASVQLVLSGSVHDQAYLNSLLELAESLGVRERVRWLGTLSEAKLIQQYAEASAILYIPKDEDYGYVTLEAMIAQRPVITTTDSGGPLEFIRDMQEGRVTKPDPHEIGRAMTLLVEDQALAEKLGEAGKQSYQELNLNWETVVERLTGMATRPTTETEVNSARTTPQISSGAGAVDQLRKAVTPSISAESNLASVEEIFAAYDFFPLQRPYGKTGKVSALKSETVLGQYLRTHWNRYRVTLSHIVDLDPHRILDVGTSPPLVFWALLANLLPQAHVTGIWEGQDQYRQTVRARKQQYRDLVCELIPCNVECQEIPHNDNTIDLVLAMEVFEHFAIDPRFFLRQSARVLKDDGHLLITTPNAVSHQGVTKALEGHNAPYSFGQFVPSGGVYGRHNREFTANELRAIAESAGFDTVLLTTADVYDDEINPRTAELLVSRGDDLQLRGENIIYIGRKARTPVAPPKNLFHGNPLAMSGQLSVAAVDSATGLWQITVRNNSPVTWACHGDQSTCLFAEWKNPEGHIEHPFILVPLPTVLKSNAETSIKLRIEPNCDQEAGILRLGLFQRGIDKLTPTKRANEVELPCSHDAFVRLIRQKFEQ